MSDNPMRERAEDDCYTCDNAGPDLNADTRCSKSKRKCGHHCNHSWTHDECDWCGIKFLECE